jgi:hypothetical protein
MAKNQRVKLDGTSKAMFDMQKTLTAMSKTLSNISNLIVKITSNIGKDLNKNLEKSKSIVDEILDSSRKFKIKDTEIPTQQKINQDLMDHIFGKSETYKLYKNISKSNQLRKQNIDSTESNYKVQVNKLMQAKNTDKINDAQYKAGIAKASKEKSDILSANSIEGLASMAIGSIEIMAIDMIIKIGKQAFKVIDDTATYSVSTSYKSNSQAREQMLTWGLSESQNYAFTQTKKLMNMSDEDLYWMNDNQKQMFSELMQKETEIYEQMTSDGTLESFQKMEIDMEVLKQEFYAYVVKFISENKDTIMYCMETGIQLLEGIMKVVSVLSSFSNWTTRLGNSLRNTSNTITLNNYISETSNATDTANKVTDSTLASLATYANS